MKFSIGKNVLPEDGESTFHRNVATWLHGVIIQKTAYSTNLNVYLMNCVYNFYVHIFRLGLRYIFFRNDLKCFHVSRRMCKSVLFITALHTEVVGRVAQSI